MFVRVVRFTDVSSERFDGLLERIEQGSGPPEGVKMSRGMLLHDAGQGTALSVQFYETREDLEESAKVFDAMDVGDTPGTRVSVDACELRREF